MARLSQIDGSSSANDAVNALRRAQPNNPGRIQLGDAGGGHGQAWKFLTNNEIVASGSIPLNSHGSKNLRVALEQLEAAVQEHGIAD